MTLRLSPHYRLLSLSIAAIYALSAPMRVEAVAPKAPTITRVEFSQAGIQSNGQPVVGTLHSYVVKWTDNALDEEGYDVQVKAGTEPFFTFRRVGANVTQAELLGVNALSAGVVVQFQVVAWKFNGTRIETATSAASSFTIPAGSADSFLNQPATFKVETVDDSRVKLSWIDTTNSELYYQVDAKEASASAYQVLAFLSHSSIPSPSFTEEIRRPRLIPDTDYHFRIRATREQSLTTTHVSPYSNIVTYHSPALAVPTSLSATLLDENRIRLRWADNSTNETGYEVQFRTANDTGAFGVLGTMGEGATFVDIPVPQGSSYQWQVVAVYTYTPPGASSSTTVRSLPSNPVTFSTGFPAPTNLQANTTGLSSTIDLTWEDNTSTEYGFDIYTRPQGTSTWRFARAVRDGMTQVSVNSRTESNDSTGKPVFIPLETGVVHEFVVRAVASDEQNVSLDSNIASATANHGFTSRLYQPIQQGQPFGYLATTTNADNRTDWTITNLPSGLTFNSGTGAITGTPTTSGVFQCPMTAHFINSPTATATLVLRVLKQVSGPYVTKAIPSTTVGINTPFRIPLADKFGDVDAEIGVRLETSLLDSFGKPRSIDIDLFPSLAPNAVANFLSYINAGDYNGMAFHRLVKGFVLQGGSLKPVSSPRTFASIPSRAAAINEPGLSNLRGTLAAAKLGARNSTATLTTGTVAKDDSFGYVGNPNSATTDFFINLADTNVANLDNQNGGFTAFGRISASGMALVNNISDLPLGSFTNNNTTSTYDASLDKRIILDGAFTPFSGIPMNAATAPADMDVNQTVRITKAYVTPTMRYSITPLTNPVAKVEVEGSDLKITGLTEGTVNITVNAADLNNASISQHLNIIVKRGQVATTITRQPAPQAVITGAKATFSVAATGTALNYQWRKKVGSALPQDIAGAIKSTFTINSTQPGDVALYDVVVWNATNSVTSTAARLDLRSLPTVGTLREAKLVEVGKPLTLTVDNVTGAPAPTFAWKRGTAAVAGQTGATLNIPAAKLTDAGVYSATASNSVGKAPTGSVNVFVVDKRITTQVHTTGRTISLTAPVAGPGMTYRWRRQNQEIPLTQARFSGMEEPVLKITGSTLDDTGDYSCVVSLPDGLGAVETGDINLTIVTRPILPALTGVNTPATAYIGVDYRWTLPFSTLAAHTPTSFSVSGLPTGLKLNTATGVISGRPTKIGIYRITATASNVAGSSTPAAVGDLTVLPLPVANVGGFSGTIAPSLLLNQNKGGRIDLAVLDTAAYSGKIVLGAETINIAGALGLGVGLFNASSDTYQSRLELKRKDKSTLILTFEIDPDFGYVTGVISNGIESASVNGFRQFWDEKWRPCPYGASPSISYNMALNLREVDVGKAEVPQGSGYLNMLVSTKGIATLSGKLADGTTLTSSSTVGPGGEALLFLMLYKNTGSVIAQIDIGDTPLTISSNTTTLRVGGEARWIKDTNQPATERAYRTGIPATFLDVLGTIYRKPGTNQIVMSLPNVDSNARLDFSEGNFGTTPRNPDRTVRITSLNTVTYPTTSDAKTTLAVNATTGSFSGSFELLDGTGTTAVKRTVTYQGLIIPSIPHTPATSSTAEVPGSGALGAGYFMLPELTPSITTSKLNSGKILLSGAPITLTTQPADQTVNPGVSNVSFTVAVGPGAQGIVTYRWRKNGSTIPGATSNVYNPGTIAESSQGDYDCVVSNGSFTLTSEVATLSVNDPVTTVTITRTPSASVLASGQSITFTATANGTPTLLYQWQKNGTDIFGATSEAYTIPTASTADTGSYTVIVRNAVTTAGITSAANVLTVADPVVITTVGRSPDTGTLTTGTPVTFSVTATGTGPLTYQWKKGGVAITGATSATYTLPSASPADTGNYDVVVKNVISTAGVGSSAVPLTVVDP